MAGNIFIPLKTVLDDSGIKKAQSEFGKLGKSLKGALSAVGVGLSIGAITSSLEAAGRAAAADAKSQGLLAIALSNTVGATDSQIASVESAIGKMESMSAVADDQIRPAFAQLARVTGDVGKATELTNLALNVAAGTGRDLGAVTIALGKAYQGNTASLAKLGINVKGVKDPMAELARQFAGSAEAAANLDPYQRLSIVMDNLQEKIGQALLPYLNDFADWLNSPDGSETIDNFASSVTNLVTVMGNLSSILNSAKLQNGLASFAILTGVAAGNVDNGLVSKTAQQLLNNVTEGGLTLGFGASKKNFKAGLGTLVLGNQASGLSTIGSIRAIESATTNLGTTTDTTSTKTTGLTTAQKKAAEAAKLLAAQAKAAAEAAEAAAKAYLDAAAAAQKLMEENGKLVGSFVDLFKVQPDLGAFESVAVDAFTSIFDSIDSALADGLILDGAAQQLRTYAAQERSVLQGIAKQRDILAGRIDVAKSITAGVMGLVNITGLLETTSKSVTQTVSTIVNGISVATTKTFDVVSSGGLVDNFQKLVDKTKAFAKNLIDLKKLGLNKQLFAQLVNAGADAGGATAQALVDGGADTISALNSLYSELALSAGDIAATATDTLYEVGQQVVSNGFIEGLLSQDSELQRAAQTLAEAFADTFTAQLQVAVDAALPDAATLGGQITGGGGGGGLFNGRPMMQAASVGRGTIFNVNVSAGVVTDPNSLARTVIDSVKKYERSNGSVWVAA